MYAYLKLCSLICLVKVHPPTRPALLASFSAFCMAGVKVLMWQTEEKMKTAGRRVPCEPCLSSLPSHSSPELQNPASAFRALPGRLPNTLSTKQAPTRWASTLFSLVTVLTQASVATASPLPWGLPRRTSCWHFTRVAFNYIVTFHCQPLALIPASDHSLELLTCVQPVTPYLPFTDCT